MYCHCLHVPTPLVPLTTSLSLYALYACRSLGCMLYEMMTLQPPFRARTQQELQLRISAAKFPPVPPGSYSPELIAFANALLDVDPRKRCGCVCQLQRCDCNHHLASCQLMPHCLRPQQHHGNSASPLHRAYSLPGPLRTRSWPVPWQPSGCVWCPPPDGPPRQGWARFVHPAQRTAQHPYWTPSWFHVTSDSSQRSCRPPATTRTARRQPRPALPLHRPAGLACRPPAGPRHASAPLAAPRRLLAAHRRGRRLRPRRMPHWAVAAAFPAAPQTVACQSEPSAARPSQPRS